MARRAPLSRAIFAASVLPAAVAFPFVWGILALSLPRSLAAALTNLLPLDSLADVWPLSLLMGGFAWGYLIGRLDGRYLRWKLAAVESLVIGPVTLAVTLGPIHSAVGSLFPASGPSFAVSMLVVSGCSAGLAGFALGRRDASMEAGARACRA